MPDNVEALLNLVDSTRRGCYFLTGLFGKILSYCTSPLVAEKEDRHLSVMAATNPIDISSSDSESWNLDDYREMIDSPPRDIATSANSRVLPSWASGPSSSAMGHVGPSRNVPSPRIAIAFNGSSSNFKDHELAKVQRDQGFNDNGRDLISHKPYDKYSSGNDYQKHSSQSALKRTLPTSLQPSGSGVRSSNLVEDVDGSRIRDHHEKYYHSAWSHVSNGKNQMKDTFGRDSDGDVMIYENNGSRMLPPSLMHRRSVLTTPYASSSDPMNHPVVGEERGTDERLIYQAALQDLNQPKLEANLPDGLLSVTLLRHQKIALAWMLQKETRSLHCLGGILADDQGLGKTISVIALVQMQRSLQLKFKSEDLCKYKTEALNLDDDDDSTSAVPNKAMQPDESDESKIIPEVSTSIREFRRTRPAAGTLVVCPASVLRQWARELDEKVADEAKLSVCLYHGGNRTKDPVELAKYDVVLTTYSIVTNEVPKQPLVEEEDDEQNNGDKYGISSELSTNKKRKKVSSVSKKGKKGRKGISSSAFDSDSGTLARVGWFRVVLDEAQTIKNHRTQVARACCGLRAKRRWCLSGTPIQNAIDELFSYFRFLRYDPYANYKSFCNTIKVPISRNAVHGYKKLQAVLRAIMLRRTKGTFIDGEPIISLPPKTVHLSKVDFSAEERAFYNQLEADSRSKFKAYADAGTLSQNYANILLMLLRLRQACDHPLLVKGFNSESVGRVPLDMVKKLPRDITIDLLSRLESSLAICRLCSDPPEDAVVTLCGHVFCYQCVLDYLMGDDNVCPVPECKEQLGHDVILSKATLQSCISDDLGNNPLSLSGSSEKSIILQNDYGSSKIKAAIEILQSHCKSKLPSPESSNLVSCNGNSVSLGKAPPESQITGPIKAIVFSQWTSMLDLVENSLNQCCLEYRRLDGTMSLVARDRAVKEFNSDPEVTVMLMSLKAGNLGLNMVAACHVILLDLWWNPATEDQAIDRAHRIGQTRPVTVSRLTIKNTVEDRILALQEEKRKMVASAFGEDNGGGSGTRLTVEDLKYLFMV